MAEWKIHRRQGRCSACEREFEDGERHLSSLTVREGELSREDHCTACWDARSAAPAEETGDVGDAGAEPAEDLFWWATRFEVTRKRTLALDLESLERVFLSLEGRPEDSLRELRYVLCLLLMRKRRLKLEKVLRGEGGERLVVRRPKREALHEVDVFDFAPERIDELRAELAEVFEGFDPDGEPGSTEDEESAEAADDAAETAVADA